MHTLKLLLFRMPEGSPRLTVDEVRAQLGPRACELAPLRCRLQPMPLRLFHPVWIDAGDPDLELHVLPTRVLSPGGARELGELVSSLAAQPLDRGRPLWQLWVVDGLDSGRAAMVLKLHHTVADGHSSARIIAHLLGGLDAAAPAAAQAAPSRLSLLAGALPELASTVARSPRILRRAVCAGRTVSGLRRPGTVRLAGAFTGPMMPWNRPPTPRRTFGFVAVERSELRTVADARGCTSTELILAVLGGALRSYVLDHGLAGERGLSASVPVSLRKPGEHEWGDRVGTVFVDLCTELADPLERLDTIAATLSWVRAHREELDLEHWDDLWQLYPLVRVGYLAALAAMRRTAGRPTFSLIASSVTGPQAPLSCGRAELEEIHSLGVLTEDQGLNVTTWSYGTQVGFGVTSCPEFVPDIWDLVARIPRALEELVGYCQPSANASRSAGSFTAWT
jgi:diacylglycerol O-acyltransferase / wax synthase